MIPAIGLGARRWTRICLAELLHAVGSTEQVVHGSDGRRYRQYAVRLELVSSERINLILPRMHEKDITGHDGFLQTKAVQAIVSALNKELKKEKLSSGAREIISSGAAREDDASGGIIERSADIDDSDAAPSKRKNAKADDGDVESDGDEPAADVGASDGMPGHGAQATRGTHAPCHAYTWFRLQASMHAARNANLRSMVTMRRRQMAQQHSTRSWLQRPTMMRTRRRRLRRHSEVRRLGLLGGAGWWRGSCMANLFGQRQIARSRWFFVYLWHTGSS